MSSIWWISCLVSVGEVIQNQPLSVFEFPFDCCAGVEPTRPDPHQLPRLHDERLDANLGRTKADRCRPAAPIVDIDAGEDSWHDELEAAFGSAQILPAEAKGAELVGGA